MNTGHRLPRDADLTVRGHFLAAQKQAGVAYDELEANNGDITLECAQALAVARDELDKAALLMQLQIELNMHALTGGRWKPPR